jgi:hypothetical protein
MLLDTARIFCGLRQHLTSILELISKPMNEAKNQIFERGKEDEQKARRRSYRATSRTFCVIRRSRSQKADFAAV